MKVHQPCARHWREERSGLSVTRLQIFAPRPVLPASHPSSSRLWFHTALVWPKEAQLHSTTDPGVTSVVTLVKVESLLVFFQQDKPGLNWSRDWRNDQFVHFSEHFPPFHSVQTLTFDTIIWRSAAERWDNAPSLINATVLFLWHTFSWLYRDGERSFYFEAMNEFCHNCCLFLRDLNLRHKNCSI